MRSETDALPAAGNDSRPAGRDGDLDRTEDAELVLRIRSGTGEREAYGRLVEKHWRFLVAWALPRVGNAAEAEDVAQEAFIRAFRAIGRLQDPGKFLSWLLRIVRNLAADHVRRRKEMESLDRAAGEDRSPWRSGEHGEDPGERIDRDDEIRAVIGAMADLPDRYRTVILLKYFEGRSGTSIAAILGEPEGTVRNRLFRALAKIRRTLARGKAQAIGSRERLNGNE